MSISLVISFAENYRQASFQKVYQGNTIFAAPFLRVLSLIEGSSDSPSEWIVYLA